MLVVGLGVSAVAAPQGSVGDAASPESVASPTDENVASPTAGATSTPSGNGTAVIGNGEPGFLIGVQGSGSYTAGGYVEYVVDGEAVWRFDEADTYFDVTPLSDGRVVAAFMDGDREQCGEFSAPCARTGFVVLDPSGETVAVDERFSFPVRTSINSEVHDVEPLPGDGYVLTDMDRERILIVRDGQLVWEWRAAGFYEAPPDPTRRDWLHINDVDHLGGDRFLVSVRNANQLLVIERQEEGGEVVEVINRDTDTDDSSCLTDNRLFDADGDGDVRCGDPAAFAEQHNPQWLGDGGVLVADSGNDRIVELHRTSDGWEPAWVLDGANGRSFEWPRDADRLANGNTLVTDSRGRRVVEVTETGATVRSYSTGNGIVYEADLRAAGERVGGVLYNVDRNGTDADTPVETVVRPDTGSELPVLGEAASLARAALPWLPLWIRGPQIAVVVLSLGLIAAGGVSWVRNR